MSLYSIPKPAGYRAQPTTGLLLDARSDTFIVPGRYTMPLPTTDAELVAQGWPSILGAVDGDLWLCDEAAGNLVGEINGYQLAPQNAPLQNRDFHGLPYGGNLWAKKAVETPGNLGNNRFVAAAGAGVLDIGAGVDFTISLLVRPLSIIVGTQIFIRKFNGAIGWDIYALAANGQPIMRITDAGGGTGWVLPVDIYDGALHLLTVSIDRNGNVSWYFDATATVAAAALRPGDLTNNDTFALLNYSSGGVAFGGQCAWAYVNIGVAASRVGHDALWAALNSDWLGTDNTYARTNPLTYGIAASRVATSAAGMLPVAYAANASVADNALRTGIVCEDGATFERIGSTDLYTNTTTFNCAKASIDGPSGMRDGCRITMAGAFPAGGRAYTAAIAIVGVSNISWRADADYKRGIVNTTARANLLFTGSAGGSEWLAIISDNATPVDWTRNGGSVTPVNADQTTVYWVYGASANLDDCDWAEPALIKNRATASLAWRRVGTAAAAATSTPSLSYANAANAVFNPAQGRLSLRISDFAGTNGATFLGFGAAAAAGALVLDYNAGALRMRVYNNAGALVGTAAGGVLAAATEYTLTVEWNAAVGKFAVFNGATVLCSYAGTWTPAAAGPNPVYVGTDAAGANAARCNIELLELWNY